LGTFAELDELQPAAVTRAARSRRVLYVQYTNPCGYPPLLHSSEILAERGWEVLLLGTQALGFETAHPPNRPGVRFRHLAYCASGWKREFHYLWYCIWCVLQAFRWRPAWIYASDPSACIPALLLHALSGARMIYHEHDSPGEVPPHAPVSLRMFVWARRKAAKAAVCCILPNENRAQSFRRETGVSPEKVKVVWNTPLRKEVSAAKRPSEGSLKLLYHGSIVPARVPLSVIHAIRKVHGPVVLRIAGYETIGSRGYVAELQRTAANLGIPESLEVVGLLQRDELMEYCRTCDVGLAVVPPAVQERNLANLVGASNKVFDYMACGLAVLVPQMPGWEEFLSYGLACDPMDADSIARALQYFCDRPAEMRSMGERGRQRILETWNYAGHFLPVAELMEA
jgi:glycosyltransferase involved in cell wall biosynthesis